MKNGSENTSDIEKSVGKCSMWVTLLTAAAVVISLINVFFTVQEANRLFLLGFIPIAALIISRQMFSAKQKKTELPDADTERLGQGYIGKKA